MLRINHNGQEVWLVAVGARLPSPKAGSADSVNDAVAGDETVRVLQDLINGIEFKVIELGIGHKSVLALAKTTEESRFAGRRAHRIPRMRDEIIN
jgi:hypothetical protein